MWYVMRGESTVVLVVVVVVVTSEGEPRQMRKEWEKSVYVSRKSVAPRFARSAAKNDERKGGRQKKRRNSPEMRDSGRIEEEEED